MKGQTRTTIIRIVLALVVVAIVIWFVSSTRGANEPIGTEYQLRTLCLEWWQVTDGACSSSPAGMPATSLGNLTGNPVGTGLCYKVFPTTTVSWGNSVDAGWVGCYNYCRSACMRLGR